MPDSNTSLLNKKVDNDAILAKEEAEVEKQLAAEEEGAESQETVTTETPAEETKTEGDQETPDAKEETKTEETQTETETKEDTSPADADSDKEAHSKLSARGQKRFAELNGDAKKVPDLEKKIEVLEKIIESTSVELPEGFLSNKKPADAAKSDSKLPWDQNGKQEDSEDGTLTTEQLDAQVKDEATKAAREESRRVRIATRLQTDGVLIEEKYPEFRKPTEDKPNDRFDQDLTAFAWKIFHTEFEKNPETRLMDVVEQVMSVKRKAAEEARKQQAAIVDKQDAEQAIDPSGTPQFQNENNVLEGKIKSANSMKELEALEKSLTAE